MGMVNREEAGSKPIEIYDFPICSMLQYFSHPDIGCKSQVKAQNCFTHYFSLKK
jgi:hypothetical protein